MSGRGLTSLHSAFGTPPTHAQFACDGVWEEAWTFSRTTLPTERELVAYTRGRRAVAFEVFFDQAFIGVRQSGTPDVVEQFASDCLDAFPPAADAADLCQLLPTLSSPVLLPTAYASAEIGAVNAWRRIPPLAIAVLPTTPEAFDVLWARLQAAPIGRDDTHPKAIEFVFGRPSCWVALPVSEEHSPHRVSRQRLQHATAGMTTWLVAR